MTFNLMDVPTWLLLDDCMNRLVDYSLPSGLYHDPYRATGSKSRIGLIQTTGIEGLQLSYRGLML